jgi:hypothetical protein
MELPSKRDRWIGDEAISRRLEDEPDTPTLEVTRTAPGRFEVVLRDEDGDVSRGFDIALGPDGRWTSGGKPLSGLDPSTLAFYLDFWMRGVGNAVDALELMLWLELRPRRSREVADEP